MSEKKANSTQKTGAGPTGDAVALPWRLVEPVVMGVRFFSRLPVPGLAHRPPQIRRMVLLLPIASLIIGLVPALLILALGLNHVPALFCAVIGVGAAVLVTGAMHEDGLADSVDGLFGAVERARRLEIMKDSRVGAFGVLAIVLSLMLRVSAVATLLGVGALHGALGWLMASVAARSGALWLSYILPAARRDGLSHQAGRGALGGLLGGTLLAGGLVYGSGVWLGLSAIVWVILVIMVMLIGGFSWFCWRKVGGQTGDLIGALQQILEIAFLASFMMLSIGSI